MTSLFKIKDNNLIAEAKYIASPNYDLRPPKTEVDLLVIHGISLPPGVFNNQSIQFIIDLFTNKLNPKDHPYFQEIYQLQVSCHCLITRNGKIIQFVPFNYRAWHAGNSCFKEKVNCNDFSIGIELEGCEEVPYTSQQYQQLAILIKSIRTLYPKITKESIVSHSFISPGRKTDPGNNFDWGNLYKLI